MASQWCCRLKDRFQLVLLDARGHGLSDKPHTVEDYAWDKRASDVIAVADEVGIDNFTLWGYSMGAVYAYWVGYYYPDRVNGLIIGGIDPYSFDEDDSLKNMNADDPDQFITQFEQALNSSFPPEAKEQMLKNDLYALAALVNTPLNPDIALSELPGIIGCRCLVYSAEDDKYFAGAKHLRMN